MRIGLLTGSIAAIPSIQSLQQQQILCGIAAQDVLVAGNPSIEKWLQQQSPEFIVITQSSLNEGLKQWLEKCKPDIVIVYGFSWVLPQQLFSLSQFGFFNIHFSLLPAYKGPVPLFWQLKNSEKTTGISIHQMTEKLDAGKVVF